MQKCLGSSLSLLILVILFSGRSQANVVDLPLNSPRNTFKVFLKNMVLVKQQSEDQNRALKQAISTLNLQHIAASSRGIVGKSVVRQLMTIFDKLERVDYATIPESTQAKKWTYLEKTIDDQGEAVLVEIAVSPNKQGHWLFTARTVNTVNLLFHHMSQQEKVVDKGIILSPRERLQNLLPSWGSQKFFIFYNDQWIGLFLIFLFGFILEKIVRNLMANYVSHKFSKLLKVELTLKRKNSFTLPFGILTVAIVWLMGISLLGFGAKTLLLFSKLGYITCVLAATLIAHHIIDMLSYYFETVASRTDNKFDDILVPLISKSAKVIAYTLGVLFMAHVLGLDVTNLLAGLGIGGLAFALAAKDTLANFFGSLMIVLDRPFEIGDWVCLEGDLHGSIEEVGFRSTRIRTFYESVITIPNGQLTNMKIDNYQRRRCNRFRENFSIQYDTPVEKIEAFCEAIRHLIKKTEQINSERFHVCLNQFSGSSIDVMVYMFFEVDSYANEMIARHNFLSHVLNLANKMDIRFAFPTQTVHLFQETQKKYKLVEADPDKNLQKTHEQVEKILESPIQLKKHISPN
jgi:MscS family membrane protein